MALVCEGNLQLWLQNILFIILGMWIATITWLIWLTKNEELTRK